MGKFTRFNLRPGRTFEKINAWVFFAAIIPSIVLVFTLFYSFIQGWVGIIENCAMKMLPSTGLFGGLLQVMLQVALLLLSVFAFNELTSYKHCKRPICWNDLADKTGKNTAFVFQLLVAVICENIWCWFCLHANPSHGASTTKNQVALNHLAHGDIATVYFFILLVLVVAPLCEEFIFRYMIFTLTQRYFGFLYSDDSSPLLIITPKNKSGTAFIHASSGFASPVNWWAWIYSSILFAFLHTPTTISAFDLYFGLGMIIGWFYIRYNSPRASVLCHMCINATSLLIMML